MKKRLRKKQRKKLALKAETVRVISEHDADLVQGRGITDSCNATCSRCLCEY